jgi:hypothetical protein
MTIFPCESVKSGIIFKRHYGMMSVFMPDKLPPAAMRGTTYKEVIDWKRKYW